MSSPALELPVGALSPSSVTIDGTPVDLHGVLAELTIRHGRTGYYDSPAPSTCTLTLLGVARSFTSRFRLGSLLVVSATDGSTEAPRFTGRFTDARLSGDSLELIAVGRLRTFGGYTIGAAAYPEEPWSARVTRAFTDAGLAAILELQAGIFDPILVARAAGGVELDQYLGELGTMIGAAIADRPNGNVLVQAINARTNAGAYELDPAEVGYAPEWEELLPLSNIVTVVYGDPSTPASVTVRDDASVALYGPIEVELSTTIKAPADANAVATNRLARDAYARWQVPAAALLYGRRLAIGAPIILSSLPPAAPASSWSPILEGWTDHVVSDGDELTWTMELALSDPLLSGLTLSWESVPIDAAHQWNTINQTVAWRDALSLGDLAP